VSNVLIGIIGVILFIGLALAGALILGDDFRTSRTTAEAATIQQQMTQVSAAYEMYRLKTGGTPQGTDFPHLRARAVMTTMMPRFLKSLPTTQRPDSWWFMVDENGDPQAANPTILMFNISGNANNAVAVCDTVAEMAGMADAQGKSPVLPKPPAGVQQGCYQYQGSWGFAQGLSGNIHFFRRM
jgi:hypothetical protein